MSTHQGLSRFDLETETFKSYVRSHGLQSNEFNLGAAYQSPDGELMFGGVNGFNIFHPDRIVSNMTAPPVVLTSVLRFDEPVEFDRPLHEVREIELTHKDDVITFEVAALDYSAPEKNRYAYKLEGLTEDWVELGRRTTFTDLDPGRHKLRFRASNNDGVWNEDSLVIDLHVRPPPWRTWWAYVLYALAFGLAAFGVQRARLRKQQRQRALRLAREEAEAARRGAGGRGDGQPGQERIPGQHEPRDPHAHERCAGDDHLDARHRAHPETAGIASTRSGSAASRCSRSSMRSSTFPRSSRAGWNSSRCPSISGNVSRRRSTSLATTAANKGLDLGYWIEKDVPGKIVGRRHSDAADPRQPGR